MSKVTPAMLAKMSVDLRIAIDAEGRLPVAVVMIFAKPTNTRQVSVRVNEYERDARTNEILDAVSMAIGVVEHQQGLGWIDPYHPNGPLVERKASQRHKNDAAHEGERDGS